MLLIYFLLKGEQMYTSPWFMVLFYAGFLCVCQVAKEYCKKYGSDKVRVISLEKNRGKGGAVRTVINTFISFSV